MNKFLRNLTIFIVIIIFIIAFSSSYSSHSMDNLAYVLAIGIDTSTNNNLKVTFQFSTTSSISESGSNEKPSPVFNTVEASSLSNAINLINVYMGKEINMSHCKMIIFSEEIAQKGISSEIYTLINDAQVRPSTNILVTKSSSDYYIENTKPELESLISKYYSIITNSSDSTGYMPNATIGDFFNNMLCDTVEPYAILGGNSNISSQNQTDINSQKDYNMKANESSIQGEASTENIGVAVFKGDKLVGELNALESISFLTLRDEINSFLVSVPDPNNSSSYIDILLKPDASPSIKVSTLSGNPYIKINTKFNGRIFSMTNSSDYSEESNLDIISKHCNSYLESTFSNYLYKSSKEFNSDITGFAKYALSNFLTTKDFNNYNWLDNYKNSFFDVKVNTSVKSGMLLNNT